MRVDDRFLEEIKSRLRLSDVIGRTVKLRRQGREYVGLSPFNKEKSPSFFVNDDKGFYHDFSSGKHGDLISFLQETERLSFMEAVERLAGEAGVPMPAPDPRAAEQARERQDLSEWLETAGKWFEAELRRPAGAEARAYLIKRGLPETEWARFRLGYAPGGRTALKDYLVTKGARPQELVEAGLLIAPEEGGQPYDRFRERIIFPIADSRGRTVSFGGRAMDPQARAKYLNGPETSLFHKGSMLYGMAEARRLLAAGETDAALVVVEGYMDVIACQRAGVAAVAPLGTALTEEQMEALWRLHPAPTLCFDGDGAGQRAASRAIDRALPLLKSGRSFKFAMVSGGKDPDDVLREQGAAALKAQLNQTEQFVDKLYVRESAAAHLDTPEGRAGLKVRCREIARLIVDKDLSEQYLEFLLRKFGDSFPRRQFVKGWKPFAKEDITVLDRKQLARNLRDRLKRLNSSVFVAGVINPDWMLPYVEEISAFGFDDDRLSAAIEPLIEGLSQDNTNSRLIKSVLHDRGVLNIFDTAFRISHEISVYKFLDDETNHVEARKMWSKAAEAIIELAAIKAEVLNVSIDSDPNTHMERRKQLSSRRLMLEKSIRDLAIWDEL